jgi:hypothetical protein
VNDVGACDHEPRDAVSRCPDRGIPEIFGGSTFAGRDATAAARRIPLSGSPAPPAAGELPLEAITPARRSPRASLFPDRRLFIAMATRSSGSSGAGLIRIR